LSNLSVRNTPNAKRIRSSFSPAPRKGDYWTSGQKGAQIQLHLIDEACIERLAKHLAATLD
jgi:hypothetical protein